MSIASFGRMAPSIGIRGGVEFCDEGATRRAIRILGIEQDITERKNAEIRLRESEARLAAALDGGRLGMWEWDVGVDCSVWNATEFELLGLPVGDGCVPTHLYCAEFRIEV